MSNKVYIGTLLVGVALGLLLNLKLVVGFFKYWWEQISPPDRKVGLQKLSRQEILAGASWIALVGAFLLLLTSCTTLEKSETAKALRESAKAEMKRVDQKMAKKVCEKGKRCPKKN